MVKNGSFGTGLFAENSFANISGRRWEVRVREVVRGTKGKGGIETLGTAVCVESHRRTYKGIRSHPSSNTPFREISAKVCRLVLPKISSRTIVRDHLLRDRWAEGSIQQCDTLPSGEGRLFWVWVLRILALVVSSSRSRRSSCSSSADPRREGRRCRPHSGRVRGLQADGFGCTVRPGRRVCAGPSAID